MNMDFPKYSYHHWDGVLYWGLSVCTYAYFFRAEEPQLISLGRRYSISVVVWVSSGRHCSIMMNVVHLDACTLQLRDHYSRRHV